MILALWFVALSHAFDGTKPAVDVLSVERGEIDVNGALDEAAWSTAIPVTDLLRHRPSNGGPPPCPTEVRFLQDDRGLYVGARVFDCDYTVRARIGAREQINEDDQIGVYLDTIGDGRSGYLFYVNPHGVQQDIRTSNGEFSFSWNTAFTTRGHITDDGYEIEMLFPWRSLKYTAGESEQTWGVVVTRVLPSLGAKYSFPLIEDGHPRVMTLAAPLRGVAPPRRGSGLELIPGLTAGQAWPREDGSRTGFDRWDQVLRPSADLRFGITPDLGITATLNPDFSQVEADVPDVRVNPRFAFQFAETRPFFLDGFEYYEDRPNTLYTRSVNEPVYGVKLSGKEGPVSVGLLNTLDRSPLPSFNSAGTRGFGALDVAGRMAVNNVLRARVDAFGNGFVGMTYAEKRLVGDSDFPVRAEQPGAFQGGGFDLEVPLDDRWRVGASTQQTFVGVVGDPLLWGMRNMLNLQRQEAFGTGVGLWAVDTTPEHRLETGFSPQSGLTNVGGELNHNFSFDAFVDTAKPELEVDAVLERDGDRLLTGAAGFGMQFADVHGIDAKVELVDQIERGVAFQGWFAELEYGAEPFSWLTFAPEFLVGRELDYELLVPGQSLQVSWRSSLFPITWLRLDTLASWERFDAEAPGPEGQPEESSLVRNSFNLQFSRELGLRVIESWTDATDAEPGLASSVLLTWLRVPGTAAYLGYSERTDLGTLQMVERTVFAKATVLIRP